MIISEAEGKKIFDSFTQVIAGAKQRPKGVLVSYELFHELHKRNLIDLKLATPGGVPQLEAFGMVIPYFNGDIYIHCDPINLPVGDIHYCLPPGL